MSPVNSQDAQRYGTIRRAQLVLLAYFTCRTNAFLTPLSTTRYATTTSELGLIPISKFRDQLTFLDTAESCNIDREGLLITDGDDADEAYTLCVVEESDLPDTARFVIEAFGADAIALSQDMSTLERALLQPSVGLFNAYSTVIAYAEVFAGVLSRTKDRKADIAPPELTGESRDEKLAQAERSSLILVLAKDRPGTEWNADVIASVELRLQPTDAKIPFSFPGLDQAERKIASLLKPSAKAPDLQPYLSNLCVSESFRRKKVGKALVRCVEDIAKTSWNYKKMYLHVDLDNTAALKLYEKEGYKDAGQRWRPFWAGKAADIGYFVKKLES